MSELSASMPAWPEAPPCSRGEAVGWADAVRSARAGVVAAVAAGRPLGEVFEAASNRWVGMIKVLVVLEAVPGLGKVRSRRVLAACAVEEGRPVAELTIEERTRILESCAAALDGAAPHHAGA